ncbi:MAG TPA: CHAT domain-containing protein [Pyrinomonadaceae bacterium]|jgi:hypothetical protein
MFDERAFISRVESAGPEELAELLKRPTVEQEKALRAHLGDERYQRMHSMALKRGMTRNMMRSQNIEPRGNVVVIHGIMGAELSVSSGGSGDLTWVNAFRIMRGWADRLRLNDEGRSEFNSRFKVSATGIMKRYYGELLLTLSEKWNVRAFWFDWRKDLVIAADELNSKINEWFGSEAPVHIVAHSMGGLVARTFIKRYEERWNVMRKRDPNFKTGGRLVMLGTPNHGSFAIPQVITGIEGLVKKIALIDLRHNVQELLATFNSFVGSYQMLPSPLVMPSMKKLYNSGTYKGFGVPQTHLTNAENHHTLLKDTVDRERMIYIAGYDQPTFSGIRDWDNLNSVDAYEVTKDGDGRVTHSLGLLRDADGKLIPTYFIKTDHGNLSADQRILTALDELLERGETKGLSTDLAKARATTRSLQDGEEDEDPEALREQIKRKQKEDEDLLDISRRRMNTNRALSRVADLTSEERNVLEEMPSDGQLSPEERKVEETITRGFLAYRDAREQARDTEFYSSDGSIESTAIEIDLIYGGIQEVNYETIRSARIKDDTGDGGNHPVDAISVGHYVGVQPAAAELALDQAISAALLDEPPADPRLIDKPDLILTQYTDRGIIHGKLGQPFILPDPRERLGRSAAGRVIAIAGMGEPGRFGAPELTVLVRELCWALGRLKKRHLATVLIGTGAGNLSIVEAVSAWMSGIRRALTGSSYDEGRRLRRITFVEHDPRRIHEIDKLLRDEKVRQKENGLDIIYRGKSKEVLEDIKREAYTRAQKALEDRWKNLESMPSERRDAQPPTRVTLGLDAERKTYRFGAITDTASVPEREITLDPMVVLQANDELAGEQNPSMQCERGRFLEELLMPDDLRRQLYNSAPLVMMLDSTTARIHWEMVAQPELSPAGTPDQHQHENGDFDESNFLGTSRGFTRQLRTTFAPPPEPPPPPRRVLRVLVVADPAPDAHLPGAQEEGVAVADLFESYNTVYKDDLGDRRVEVVRLFGPLEATRTNVLRELLVRPYDVLHFAGHCVYRWGGDPTLSGWIFNAGKKEILSANELNRIDRIPKFVFSNACESGITPDRSQERSADLAPSFAEAFFARGVANFVCTAWPVDDLAARQFALTLYSGLLGIEHDSLQGRSTKAPVGAKLMHAAMRDARIQIARTPNGRTTWGAYQHYGNPFFQFFYTPTQQRRHEAVAGEGDGGTSRASKKRAGSRRATKKRASRKG